MTIQEAINIIRPDSNTSESLKSAWKTKCKQYHPDINPDGLEIQKLINAAYDLLKKTYGQWSFDSANSDTPLDDIIQDLVNKLKHLSGLTLEICGAWLCISGNTKTHKNELKSAGLRYAAKKQMWYW